MKKWVKQILISVLIITALAALPVSAKNSGTAELTKAEDSNNVSVAIELTEGVTEAITSLRFQMYISIESGTMGQPKFTFAGLPSEVRDAQITWDEEDSDYIIDIILAGKPDQVIFDEAEKITIGTIEIPEGKFYAEVGLVAADDAEDSDPVLQYVESAGMQTISVPMTNAQPVYVGEKQEQETEPKEPETEPQTESESESEPVTEPQTESESEPATEPQTESESEPVTEPQTEPESEPVTEPQTESESEPVTEPQTESESEPVTEPQTESESEPVTEPQSEPVTEPQTEEKPSAAGPAAPTFAVSPKVGTRKVVYTWPAVPDADGYEIYMLNEKTGKYVYKETVAGDKTSFTGTGAFGKSYTLKMRSYRLSDDLASRIYGEYSEAVTIQVSAFDKSQQIKADAKTASSSRHVYFTWKQVAGADGYLIYRYNSKTKKYEHIKTITNPKKTSYRTPEKYANAASYAFKMRAYALDHDGKTKVLSKATSSLWVKVPPKKTAGVSAVSAVKSQVQIAWKKTEKAQGYRVLRATSKNGKYTRLKTIYGGNVLTYTDKSAKSGRKYYYKVRAFIINQKGQIINGSLSSACSVKVK